MTFDSADELHLLRAIELARLSRANGNHPFGSLLVDAPGQVVLEAENTVVTERDVTGHAETNVVRMASMRFDPVVLEGAALYTSTEPCAMCSGAIYWSGIARVVYALGSDALTELVSEDEPQLRITCRDVFARGERRVEVSGPHLVEQARAVHDGFWSERRNSVSAAADWGRSQ